MKRYLLVNFKVDFNFRISILNILKSMTWETTIINRKRYRVSTRLYDNSPWMVNKLCLISFPFSISFKMPPT